MLRTDDFVFATRKGPPIDLHNVIARHVKPTCELLGIPQISWHDLRKATATWARQARRSVEETRDLLRHESATTTLHIYSQLAANAGSAEGIERYVMGQSVASEVLPEAVV